MVFCFFFKQKTAYEMRISDWSSDVCSSDLAAVRADDVALQLAPRVVLAHRQIGVGRAELEFGDAKVVEPGTHLFGDEGVVRPDRNIALVELNAEIGRASCRERVCQYV